MPQIYQRVRMLVFLKFYGQNLLAVGFNDSYHILQMVLYMLEMEMVQLGRLGVKYS